MHEQRRTPNHVRSLVWGLLVLGSTSLAQAQAQSIATAPSSAAAAVAPIPTSEPISALEPAVRAAALTADSTTGTAELDALIAELARVATDNAARRPSPIHTAAFTRPLAVDALAADLRARAARVAADGSLDTVADFIAHTTGAHRPTFDDYLRQGLTPQQLQQVWDGLSVTRSEHRARSTPTPPSPAQSVVAAIRAQLGQHEDSPDAPHPSPAAPDVERALELLQGSRTFLDSTFPKLIGPDLLQIGQLTEALLQAARHGAAVDPPPDVKRIITRGLIHYAQETAAGWIIVTSEDDNHIVMDDVLVIIDIGGNDQYDYSTVQRAHIQVVVDLAGNDRHEGSADFAGPASGFFGSSVLIDFKGDDVYRSAGLGTIASGFFGLGILIDHEGNDTYELFSIEMVSSGSLGIGAGVSGAGMLVDRAGNDSYTAQGMAQGFAGPGGLGVIIDATGQDTYTLTGDAGQGMGVGIIDPELTDLAGGIGCLFDLAGRDTYSAHAWAQAAAVGLAVGMLHDLAGDDTYTASTNAQACAHVHALALLTDEEGNDARTLTGPGTGTGAVVGVAASSARSVAMLDDHRGQDSIAVAPDAVGTPPFDGTLALANTALAMLIDRQGPDALTVGMLERAGHFPPDDAGPAFAFVWLAGAAPSAEPSSPAIPATLLCRPTAPTGKQPGVARLRVLGRPMDVVAPQSTPAQPDTPAAGATGGPR